MPRLCPRCMRHHAFEVGEHCPDCGGPLVEFTDPDLGARAARDGADPFGAPADATAHDTVADLEVPAPVSGLVQTLDPAERPPVRRPGAPSASGRQPRAARSIDVDDDEDVASTGRVRTRDLRSLPPAEATYFQSDPGLAPEPRPSPVAPRHLPIAAWRCTRCGILNPSHEASCVRCGLVPAAPAPRPATAPALAVPVEPSGLELARAPLGAPHPSSPAVAAASTNPWLQAPISLGSAGPLREDPARASAVRILSAALRTLGRSAPHLLGLVVTQAVLATLGGTVAAGLGRAAPVLGKPVAGGLILLVGIATALGLAGLTAGVLLVLRDRLRPGATDDFAVGYLEALGLGRRLALRVLVVVLAQALVLGVPVALVGLARAQGWLSPGAALATVLAALLPALWLLVRLWLALPLAVLDELSALAALLESLERSAGRLGRLLAVALLCGLPIALLTVALWWLRAVPFAGPILTGLAGPLQGYLYLALAVQLWWRLSPPS